MTNCFSFMVSYFAGGKRRQQRFADFDDAHREAKSKANILAWGEHDTFHLRAVETTAYVRAVDVLKPAGMTLELAAKDSTEVWKVLGGKASPLKAAKEFARQHMHELPDKRSPRVVW